MSQFDREKDAEWHRQNIHERWDALVDLLNSQLGNAKSDALGIVHQIRASERSLGRHCPWPTLDAGSPHDGTPLERDADELLDLFESAVRNVPFNAYPVREERDRLREEIRARLKRWGWFKQFLEVLDDTRSGGQYLFIHDDHISDVTFVEGFENTVDSLVDRRMMANPSSSYRLTPSDTDRLNWLQENAYQLSTVVYDGTADAPWNVFPNAFEIDEDTGVPTGRSVREAIDAAMRAHVECDGGAERP